MPDPDSTRTPGDGTAVLASVGLVRITYCLGMQPSVVHMILTR
jgi:hypothetical protein